MKIKNIPYNPHNWQSFEELLIEEMSEYDLQQDLCRCFDIQDGINQLAQRIVQLNDANTEISYCGECHVKIWIEANYCPYCGTKL